MGCGHQFMQDAAVGCGVRDSAATAQRRQLPLQGTQAFDPGTHACQLRHQYGVVWLCSRNDIIANVGVLLAAAGVAATGTMWPDFAVGSAIAVIFLRSAFYVVSQSLRGLPRHEVSAPAKQPTTSAAEACQSKGAALEPAYGRQIFSSPLLKSLLVVPIISTR
jgi:hypothetical protein